MVEPAEEVCKEGEAMKVVGGRLLNSTEERF